jgi:hypothetical protein
MQTLQQRTTGGSSEKGEAQSEGGRKREIGRFRKLNRFCLKLESCVPRSFLTQPRPPAQGL